MTEEERVVAARKTIWSIVRWVIGITLFLVVGGMAGCPIYNVWQQKLVGEGELKRAEMNRQITVTQAEASFHAAKHLANAEIERAKGVAQANQIIGESLKNNHEYLTWLWIEGMKEHQGKTVVYVPTEGSLPILEAGRGLQLKEKK